MSVSGSHLNIKTADELTAKEFYDDEGNKAFLKAIYAKNNKSETMSHNEEKISGAKLGIKTADELNVEESNKPFLKKQFEEYDKQKPAKEFKQNVDADDNGGVEVKAIMEGLTLSHFIPNKINKKEGVSQVHFNNKLKEVIKKEDVNRHRLPTILF